MKLKAFCVYDAKALVYHPPFFLPTDGAALRAFADLSNDLNTSVGRHPGDYSLWSVGEYDDQSGAMTPYLPLVHIADAASVVHVSPKLPLENA